MFWKKGINRFNTLRFRLTFWFSVIFSIFFVVFFIITRLFIANVLLDRTDKVLRERIGRHISLGHSSEKDFGLINKNFSSEAREEGLKSSFHILLDSTFSICANSDMGILKNFEFDSSTIPFLPNNPSKTEIEKLLNLDSFKFNKTAVYPLGHKFRSHTIIQTIYVKERDINVRVAFQYFNNGYLYITGISLKTNEEFLNVISKIFVYSFLFLVGIVIVLINILTRKALSGVERVTSTALSIGEGKFDSRVPIGREGLEIQQLASAFNDMLSRIEILIKEQKEITHNIAHDLRSPLTSIRGISETTISNTPDIHDYETMAGKIISNCDRLINMINSMLDISDIDSGLFNINFESVDLNNILEETYDMYLPLAEEKNISFKYEESDTGYFINGNKHLLQRAIGNIVDNAIKYTQPEGSITISIISTKEVVHIIISDTGIGIPENEQKKIFERFYRIDKSRSTGGNGLGLSLANAYIRFQQGYVELKSQRGYGSTFTISFPNI